MRFAIGLATLALVLAACAGDESSSVPETATRPLRFTRPVDTPPLDPTRSSVELDKIVFDTFDGRSVTLPDATPATVARVFDAISPIDAPDYEPAGTADEWLTADDLVVGYVDPAGGAWAYPVRILNKHEIVNDELGGQPVVITYCPLCGSGIVYDRSTDAGALSFSNTSALLENDMVMVDRETGTYWWQVAGAAVVGELTGVKLSLLPSETTTWASWRADHPVTGVLARPLGRDYSRDSFAGYAARLDAGGATPFPVSPGVLADGRLTPATRVIVVAIGDESRAWPVAPARIVSEVVAGQQITVETNGTGGAVVDADGNPVPSKSAFWFAVVSAYPGVTVGG